MKKWMSFVFAVLICMSAFSLYGCGNLTENAATVDSVSDEFTVSGNDLIIKSLYGNLYYPSSWLEQFDYKIEIDSLYTVSFIGNISDKTSVELYSLVFADKEAEIPESAALIGKIKDKKLDVYLLVNNILDKKLNVDEENTFLAMQEELNYTVDKLSEIDGFESKE